MGQMGRMVLYADCIPRLRFFERLGRALRELRTPYVILTHRLSVRVLASEHGLPSRLARLSPNQSQADVRGSLEVVAGNLTAHHAQALYWSVYRTLQRMLAEHGISTIVVWNGDGVCGKAIRDFAEEHAVATLFLEVANLPGKLFADRRGVNARSALADDTSILSTYSPDMDEFQRWREDYIATKMRSHIVPQSRKRVPITGWPLVDWVGWQVLGCPRDSDLSVVDRAKRRFAARAHDYTYDDVGRLDPSSYVFYPMQVSNDSQVLINSTVDNRQAIKMAAMIADEESREAFMLWARKVKLFFGGGVDGITPEVQVILCEATADYLYSRYTPTKVEYRQGSRPFLEKIVRKVTQGFKTDREKVFSLMRFVRDLSPNPERKDLFVGGTEEEIIKKQAWVCNEKARALIILWQIAGYPSRFIGHHIGGHATTEVYLDGKWCYMDVRGKYFFQPDGSLASAWEIIQNPLLITSQKPEVYLDMAPGYNIDESLTYFNPREVTGINNYFVSDMSKYDYTWMIDGDWAEKSGYARVQDDYMKVRARVLGLEQ